MTLTPLTTILTMTLSENDADSNNNADNDDANDYDADEIANKDNADNSNADQDASLPDWACFFTFRENTLHIAYRLRLQSYDNDAMI